jgi:alkaline phosphatase
MNKYLSVLLCAVSVGLLGACTSSSNDTPKKNVIFFLGDGMGITVQTAARIYGYGEDGELTMDKLPETAFIKTFSQDFQVTDSAPSMSAYMTGVKMNQDVISMSSETTSVSPGKDASTLVSNSVNNCAATNGKPVQTLLELAKIKNMGTGIVTTARLTHATPAATFSHVCNRNAEYEIARQTVPGGAGYNNALVNGVDVMMGGNSKYFIPFNAAGNALEKAGRPDGRNLINEMKLQGYSFASDLPTLNAVPVTASTKLLALFDQGVADAAFSGGHMSYDLDRNPAVEPSLAEMTTKAMDILAAKNNNGYTLVVEGGRIDHALHATNAKRALQDTIAFDNAIAAAIAKVKLTDPELKNTLIVVTADHDHTMVMQGYSALTGKTTASNAGILGVLKQWLTPTVNAKDADGATFSVLAFGNGPNRVIDRAAMTPLTDAITGADNYQQEAAIRTGAEGESHGGGDVWLGAIGMNANLFKGNMENIDVFPLIVKALGF